MISYRFRCLNGQSGEFHTIEAEDDADFKTKRQTWEEETGLKWNPYTLVCKTNGIFRAANPTIQVSP